MLRILVVILVLFIEPAVADVQSCQKIFDTIPQILDQRNEAGTKNYEDENPGLGYSISFAEPRTYLTLFFYDQQQKSISASFALESFKQAARDMQVGAKERGSELRPINAFQLNEQTQMFALRAEAEALDGVSELLALGVVDDCIVKIRFSARFPMDEARDSLNAILRLVNEGLVDRRK